MRNTAFFLNPTESRFRQLVVIDMAGSDDREWTARLVIKTDLVEKRREWDDTFDDKFAFRMAAYDADVAMEFSINNFESRNTPDLMKWCAFYPVTMKLKDEIEGFYHPNKLAKYLRNRVFTLERVMRFQEDMDKREQFRRKRDCFKLKRAYFSEMIKKHFSDALDMEQMQLGQGETEKKEEIK